MAKLIRHTIRGGGAKKAFNGWRYGIARPTGNTLVDINMDIYGVTNSTIGRVKIDLVVGHIREYVIIGGQQPARREICNRASTVSSNLSCSIVSVSACNTEGVRSVVALVVATIIYLRWT